MNTVDNLDGLSGKVKSNGRVNAYKAPAALAGKQTLKLELNEGWNLPGMSITPANCTVKDLFSDLTQSTHSVWVWDGGGWAVVFPSLNQQEAAELIQNKGFQELEDIEPGEGFWVHCD
jgi:hypothetical protein